MRGKSWGLCNKQRAVVRCKDIVVVVVVVVDSRLVGGCLVVDMGSRLRVCLDRCCCLLMCSSF